MAKYAIGDVQGCYESLRRLLDKIRFDPSKDSLIFTGDLVNRGPQSLECLRLVKSLGDSADTVLGNHDFHLLAIAEGYAKKHSVSEDLQRVLDAPDCDELLDWIRYRPLAIIDDVERFLVVHAGVYPGWTLEETLQLANEVEEAMAGSYYRRLLQNMYGNLPTKWTPRLPKDERLRFVINVFTRMRYCDSHLRLLFDFKHTPDVRPYGYFPWYDLPRKLPHNFKIVFGHWSTLGLMADRGVIAIDTGCLWGGKLTALRLESLHKKSIKTYSTACPKQTSTSESGD